KSYRTYARLSNSDLVAEINVLDRVQQLHAFAHRALKRLATRDQSHAAAALVNHCRANRLSQITRALRFAARIDQAATTHVTVCHLVAHEIDRIVSGQLLINELVGLSVRAPQSLFSSLVAAVSLRQFLLNDVSLDGHAQMV